MAIKKKPWKIGSLGTEIKIVLPAIDSDGDIYENLTHIFRQPTAEDKISYYRLMTQAEIIHGIDGKPIRTKDGDYWPAINELYDRCILRVEEYKFPEQTENWKELVPLEHKQWAIELLINRLSGALSLGMQKK